MSGINEAISNIGVVPVIKLTNPERDAAPLAKALCEGGVPVAEVTFRAAGADKAIALMKQACPEMLVGAGTVLTTEQIDKAIAAGAEFIVTPGLDEELVVYYKEKNNGFNESEFITYIMDKEELYNAYLKVMEYDNIETYTESEIEDYITTIQEGSYKKEVEKLKQKMKETLDINEKTRIAKKIENMKKEVLKW